MAELDAEINFRISRDTKRKAEDMHINLSNICRDAISKVVGSENDIKYLMLDEEEQFGRWTDSFIALYQFLNAKLQDRDALVIAEAGKLEELWKRIESRMKTREQLMETVPELRELTYEDCFDWPKMFSIIEKYPKTLQGRLGVVQIREFVLYREVKAGHFDGIQAAREKLRADLELRAELAKKQLTEWTNSEEYKKQWLMKQEELLVQRTDKAANGGVI